MVSRREDWPLRLNAAVDAARERPFGYGSHDCLLFAADGVLAMTDEDPVAALRGTYGSKLEAARLVKKMGGLEAMATAAFGHKLENPALARRGDVVLCEWAAGLGLGVVLGAVAAVPAAEGGLHFAPMPLWLAAWRVSDG